MYRISISPTAKRELKNIKKTYKNTVKEAIDSLREDPFIGKSLTRELTERFSYRIGVYRIIYKINKKDKIVHVLSAGHRELIYN